MRPAAAAAAAVVAAAVMPDVPSVSVGGNVAHKHTITAAVPGGCPQGPPADWGVSSLCVCVCVCVCIAVGIIVCVRGICLVYVFMGWFVEVPYFGLECVCVCVCV